MAHVDDAEEPATGNGGNGAESQGNQGHVQSKDHDHITCVDDAMFSLDLDFSVCVS